MLKWEMVGKWRQTGTSPVYCSVVVATVREHTTYCSHLSTLFLVLYSVSGFWMLLRV